VPVGRLSELQVRVLTLLAREEASAWVLTGGAALVGFHTQHRVTRDLDITPVDRGALGDLPQRVERVLLTAGLRVDALSRESNHHQLRVSDDSETIVVDVVGGWTPAAEAPLRIALGDVAVNVDTPHELLVRKLMALFDRSEPRDLVDVEELLKAGGELRRAVSDAGRQFTGLTASTLARVVDALPLEKLAGVLNWTDQQLAEILRFRSELLARLRQL